MINDWKIQQKSLRKKLVSILESLEKMIFRQSQKHRCNFYQKLDRPGTVNSFECSHRRGKISKNVFIRLEMSPNMHWGEFTVF